MLTPTLIVRPSKGRMVFFVQRDRAGRELVEHPAVVWQVEKGTHCTLTVFGERGSTHRVADIPHESEARPSAREFWRWPPVVG